MKEKKSLGENQILSFVTLLLGKRWCRIHVYPKKKNRSL